MTTYKDAGVDIDAGNRAVDLMKKHVKETHNERVLANIGGFGGLFSIKNLNLDDPVLVSSCDGVGTKLKIAYMMNKHHTIGQDLLNHCVNDILVMGATPLFFLDYIGTGKMEPEVMAEIIRGFSFAAKENGVAIIGGESAEMPGIYKSGEYDVAGFVVGVVDKSKIITGANIEPGDLIIGLPSSGIHTNGYSLVNKLFFDDNSYNPNEPTGNITEPLGEELLKVHKSYLKEVSPIIKLGIVQGIVHVTGGGFYDNIPRILPEGIGAEIKVEWEIPEIFKLIQKLGSIDNEEMYRSFNMGIGMTLIISPDSKTQFEEKFSGEYHVIGECVEGSGVMIHY